MRWTFNVDLISSKWSQSESFRKVRKHFKFLFCVPQNPKFGRLRCFSFLDTMNISLNILYFVKITKSARFSLIKCTGERSIRSRTLLRNWNLWDKPWQMNLFLQSRGGWKYQLMIISEVDLYIFPRHEFIILFSWYRKNFRLVAIHDLLRLYVRILWHYKK